MFGLKIVKSETIDALELKLKASQEIIAALHETIAKKDSEISEYKNKLKKLESAEPKKSKKVILLTDVAETPLSEEAKTEGKPKRVVKKTSRKKVTRKTEEE